MEDYLEVILRLSDEAQAARVRDIEGRRLEAGGEFQEAIERLAYAIDARGKGR